MSEKEIEQEIQDKGLNAPRLTPDLIDSVIVSKQFHVFGDTCLTVCCLTLKNGYTVTGESACASPENFNKELGEKAAYENARGKIWALEGYLLKQALYELNLFPTTNVGKVELYNDSDWQLRIIEEQAQLYEKARKLELFTESVVFNKLDGSDKDLLHEQLAVMDEYSRILCKRIERLKR